MYYSAGHNYNNIPDVFKSIKHFCLCDESGKPYKNMREYIDPTNKALGLSYTEALKKHNGSLNYGLGMLLGKVKGNIFLIGIDIDNAFIQEKGMQYGRPRNKVIEKVMKICKGMYCELSPSRTGLHYLGFIQGKIPFNGKTGKKIKLKDGSEVEVYITGRYFRMTGWSTGKYDLTKSYDSALKDLLLVLWPAVDHYNTTTSHKKKGSSGCSVKAAEVIKKIMGSRQQAKFKDLYYDGLIDRYAHDHSRADLALACILAYWTCKDEELMMELMNSSALADRPNYRSRRGNDNKWRENEDYRWITIETACDLTTDVYTGFEKKPTTGWDCIG